MSRFSFSFTKGVFRFGFWESFCLFVFVAGWCLLKEGFVWMDRFRLFVIIVIF